MINSLFYKLFYFLNRFLKTMVAPIQKRLTPFEGQNYYMEYRNSDNVFAGGNEEEKQLRP